ncbi:MAG: hypothetical protein SFY95_03130 [Planctomycetota bacterium]|nr:hypothetical protein [Planctomycetota bacterium]
MVSLPWNISLCLWLAAGAAAPTALAPLETGSAPMGAPLVSELESGGADPTKIDSVDDLLTALERADEGLKTLTADIVYDKVFDLAGDQQTRRGKVYFEALAGQPGSEGTKARRFAIDFDQLIVGGATGRVENERKGYIFDGQWLVERTPGQKQIIKRQVAPPGEKFDPLRIGEGPLPLPIGQKKSDILSRYRAELLPADKDVAEGDKGFVMGSYQLRLVPRPEREREDEFREIRLWYRASGDGANLLPRMARTRARSGDETTVRLINVKLNAAIPAEVMDTTTPPGWDADIRPWRGKVSDAQSAAAALEAEPVPPETVPTETKVLPAETPKKPESKPEPKPEPKP